jgi:hypothetical protein
MLSLTYLVPSPLKMNGFDLFVFIYRHIIENSSKIALSAAGINYSGCFVKATGMTSIYLTAIWIIMAMVDNSSGKKGRSVK